MNRQEILDEIKKTEEHLAAMRERLKDCDEVWKPEEGEKYYYLGSDLKIYAEENFGYPSDIGAIKVFNCFKTAEEAQQEAEKILVRRQLEGIAKKLNKGEKFDWNNDSQAKHRIELYCDEIRTNYYFTYKTQGAVYCLDENFKDIAVQEIGKERLIKYLKGE